MSKPHKPIVAVLIAIILSISFTAQAQQQTPPDDQTTGRGVELYHQGKTDEAIKVLSRVVKQHPDDADAWYFLGLSQYSHDWILGARHSFEKTVELRPLLADAQAKLAYTMVFTNESAKALETAKRAQELGDQSVEAQYAIAAASLRAAPGNALEEAVKALRIKPDFLPALVTKSFAHYRLQQFSDAAESLERVLALSPDDIEADTWRNQIEELRSRAAQQPDHAFSSKEVTEKARVLSKPEPSYTERARKSGVMGTVVLRAVFSSDGEVKHILIVTPSSHGLTTAAVKAARRIKFIPAMKDGQPASQYVQLEYTFNLY